MGTKNKKKTKKIDLLEISDSERIKVIKEVKENLRQRIAEEKLWQSLLEAENLTINGNIAYDEKQHLSGFSLEK